MNWEQVIEFEPGSSKNGNSTYRLSIPEGWIYRYGSHLVFVPVQVAPVAPAVQVIPQ